MLAVKQVSLQKNRRKRWEEHRESTSNNHLFPQEWSGGVGEGTQTFPGNTLKPHYERITDTFYFFSRTVIKMQHSHSILRLWAIKPLHSDCIWTANSQCLLQENHVNLVHIESRKSKRRNSEFEIFVDCDSNHEQLNEIIQLLQKNVSVLDMEPLDNSCLHKEGELKPSAGPLRRHRETNGSLSPLRHGWRTLVPKEDFRLGQLC